MEEARTAPCRPSQRINDALHRLWICLEKVSGEIMSSNCTCMAGDRHFMPLSRAPIEELLMLQSKHYSIMVWLWSLCEWTWLPVSMKPLPAVDIAPQSVSAGIGWSCSWLAAGISGRRRAFLVFYGGLWPSLNDRYGCSSVGIPSTKCSEHTMSLSPGVHALFLFVVLRIKRIHSFLVSKFFKRLGNL